jgi:hypothetical protein
MRRGSRNCLLIALLLVLTGCAATAATEPPAGAVKFEFAVPAVGTKAVYRITDHQGGGTREETWTVVEASYEKRQVFGISDGVNVRIYDKVTGNWIATLRDGKELFSVSPDSGTFSWPLWVGKSWLATFAYYDRVRGRSWSFVQSWWKVAAYEDVTVPAGTFKALRLESSPGTNNATQEMFWYSPEAKIVVKRILERTSNHYLGYGKFTTELVKYERPRP